MGARGPQPKPLAVRLAEGNASRRPINLADGMNPDVCVPDPPSWLCKEGLKEWKRASAELYALGAIAKIDRSKFAIYCQSWGHLAMFELALQAHTKNALAQAEKQGIDPVIAATQPFFAKTPTGFLRESQLVKQIAELREQVHRYAASFGLDPSSRSRVQISTNQIPLPGFDSKPAANDTNGPPTLRSFA